MKKQIQVKITPEGKIEAVTLGIKGKKCTDYIAVLEKLLEARTESSEYTDEYYQTETITNEAVQHERGQVR
jgi:hypothetical protein